MKLTQRLTKRLSRSITSSVAGRAIGLAMLGAGLAGGLAAVPAHAFPATPCTISNIKVTGSAQAHQYKYSFDCGGGFTGTVAAGYDVKTDQAKEKVTSTRGNGQATWTCSIDPWTVDGHDYQKCTRGAVSTTNEHEPFDVGTTPRTPYTAQALSQAQRRMLKQALADALAHPPVTANPGGVLKDKDKLQLPKPDLVAVRVSGTTQVFDGQTSVYEVVVRNDGVPAAKGVNFTIAGLGAVTLQEMVDVPSNFTCSGNGTITCVGSLGGSTDPLITRVAVFRVRAWAQQKGAGSLTLTVNPDHTLDESNFDNNRQALAITVK